MNVEEVKLRGPSLPLDIHWGHFAYSRFLERHPGYSVTEGDVLIFIIGHFPRELAAVPLCVFTPKPESQLLRIVVFNPETKQSQSDELNDPTTCYPRFGVFKLA